jgi:hypothetical protein
VVDFDDVDALCLNHDSQDFQIFRIVRTQPFTAFTLIWLLAVDLEKFSILDRRYDFWQQKKDKACLVFARNYTPI